MRKNYDFGRFHISHYDIQKKDKLWKIQRWHVKGHHCLDLFCGLHLYALWFGKGKEK